MLNVRNKTRIFLLWLRERLKALANSCEYCGRHDAYPCSLANLQRLCTSCSTVVSRSAGNSATLGYVQSDSAILRWNAEEQAWQWQEEDFPCFDTFPGPPPKSLKYVPMPEGK